MTLPKPMQTEFGIHHIFESCETYMKEPLGWEERKRKVFFFQRESFICSLKFIFYQKESRKK